MDKVIVRLSGADVLDVEVDADGSILVEVRQYHRDYQNGEDEFDSDEFGDYEVAA